MSHHAISQTCFFVKPEPRGTKRKRSHIQTVKNAEAFESSSQTFEKEVEIILQAENAALLADLVAFVERPRAGHGSFPCGIIVSGGDTNFDRLYRRVSAKLRASERCLVLVDLAANECTNLKATLRKIVQTTIREHASIRNQSRVQNHDLRLVEAWEQHQQRTGATFPPTIAIVLRHVEAIPNRVLDDLVAALAVYAIDFRLLWNVSTSFNHLQDCLSAKTIRALTIAQFEADPNESTLEKIVSQQLIERPLGVRLGYDTYYGLWNEYQNANRSVDLFLAGLRYIRMCHHFTHELSWLSESRITKLNASELDIVRSLPSFQQAVLDGLQTEDLSLIRQFKRALSNDSAMQELFDDYVSSIEQYKHRLTNAMQVFFIVRENSKSTVRDRSRTELYKILLDRGLTNSNHVKELLMSVKVLREESLQEIFAQCAESLVDPSDRKYFEGCREELDRVSHMKARTNGDQRTYEQRRLALGWKDSDPDDDEKLDARELKTEHELAKQNATRQTKYSKRTAAEAAKTGLTDKEKRFTALVNDVHRRISTIFDDLINHEHLVMHELYWISIDRVHRAAFSPDTRKHLRAALTEPETFLGPTGTEPHTSALFRLFQDSGQLINLYDWSQAFSQVYNPNQVETDGVPNGARPVRPEGEEGEEDTGVDDEEQEEVAMRQQALFARSVAELKFLGFFKATKRKTDHVQKTISIL